MVWDSVGNQVLASSRSTVGELSRRWVLKTETMSDLPEEASWAVDRWCKVLTPMEEGSWSFFVFYLFSLSHCFIDFLSLPFPSHFHFLPIWAARTHSRWEKEERVCLLLLLYQRLTLRRRQQSIDDSKFTRTLIPS